MKLRNFLTLGLLSCALSAPIALAQDTPTDAVQQAMKLYDEAELHYQLQEWEKALEKYKEAYRLSREPEMLFNIGQCYRMLKKYDEAIKSYKVFQREVPDSPQRENIISLISQSEQALRLQQAATQPNAPAATQTVIIREVAAAQPMLPVPDEGMSGSTKLYTSSIGAMGASFALGGFALSTRIKKDRAAINEDVEAFQVAKTQTFATGVLSDVLAVTALGLGALSYKQSPSRRVPFALYGTSLTSAAIGFGCGALALSASKSAAASNDPIESRAQEARAQALGNASDLSFVTAIVAGGLGAVLHVKTPKKELGVTPSKSGVTVSAKF